jgi:hypothetical protein
MVNLNPDLDPELKLNVQSEPDPKKKKLWIHNIVPPSGDNIRIWGGRGDKPVGLTFFIQFLAAFGNMLIGSGGFQ